MKSGTTFKKNANVYTTSNKKNISNKRLVWLAKNNKWKELLDNVESIQIETSQEELNGVSFHEWLLTNTNDSAFKIWLMVRELSIKHETYNMFTYANSAALLLYANLPKRLNILNDDEWIGSVDYNDLRNKGIHFTPSVILQEPLKNSFETDLGTFKNLSAINLACLHGSKCLIKKAIKNKESFGGFLNWRGIIEFYLMNKDAVSVNPLVKIINAHAKDVNESDYLLSYFFARSIECLSVKKISNLWDKMSATSKNAFFLNLYEKTRHCVDNKNTIHRLLDKLVSEERVETIKYLSKLIYRYNKKEIQYSFEMLCNSVKNGSSKSVSFILKSNPEWLERKFLVCKEHGHRKMGTILTWAIINDNEEVVDFLLSQGASASNLNKFVYQKSITNGNLKNDTICKMERILLICSMNIKSRKKERTNLLVL